MILGSNSRENIDPWIQQSKKILVLGFNSQRKHWSLDSTVWENIDMEKIRKLQGTDKEKIRQEKCSFLVPTVWEKIGPWVQQFDKIVILWFNSLRKYWSLVRTVWENCYPLIQQSEKLLILGSNSLRKKLVLAFTNLRKCLRKNWNLVLTVWENIFFCSNSLRKYWSLSSTVKENIGPFLRQS